MSSLTPIIIPSLDSGLIEKINKTISNKDLVDSDFVNSYGKDILFKELIKRIKELVEEWLSDIRQHIAKSACKNAKATTCNKRSKWHCIVLDPEHFSLSKCGLLILKDFLMNQYAIKLSENGCSEHEHKYYSQQDLLFPYLFRRGENTCIRSISIEWSFHNKFVESQDSYMIPRFFLVSESDRLDHLWLAAQHELGTDVCFKKGNQFFHAHKFVLVTHSEYFKKMFLGEFIESKMDEILVDDFQTYKGLVYFLYTGKMDEEILEDTDSVLDLYKLADKHVQYDLINVCLNILEKKQRSRFCPKAENDKIQALFDDLGCHIEKKNCCKNYCEIL